MGLVHVDAHTDTGDKALGEKIYHGTPFRRCVDEGLLDCKRVVQIGIRGSSYTRDPYKYCRDQVRKPPLVPAGTPGPACAVRAKTAIDFSAGKNNICPSSLRVGYLRLGYCV